MRENNKHYNKRRNNWKKNNNSEGGKNNQDAGRNKVEPGRNGHNNGKNFNDNHAGNKPGKNNGEPKLHVKTFKVTKSVTDEQIRQEDEAIRNFKSSTQLICAKCGQPVQDITQAISGKTEGSVMHFDCVIQELQQSETLGPGDKITYIGQGRFGILHFDNPHDQKHFQIKKIIEWENKEKKADFRNEMADLYSTVK